MWIKTQWGQLVNLDTASAIWAGEEMNFSKFCGGSSDEYNVEARLNTGIYELGHPLTTPQEVTDFVNYLTKEANADSSTGSMWKVHLLGFSLMYIDQ